MLEFKRLRDGRYEVTVGCESLFISNSLDNVFEFVLQYIQRVENKQIKGVY